MRLEAAFSVWISPDPGFSIPTLTCVNEDDRVLTSLGLVPAIYLKSKLIRMNTMRTLFCVLLIALLPACATSPGDSGTGEKDRVAAATQAWIDAMSSHDQERVVALYDPEAVFWGTTSPTLRDNPAAVREYFNVLRTVPPDYKAMLNDQRIRVYGDIAINTGTYIFVGPARDAAGKPISRAARFSFVYRNRDGRWLIVDHHSSAVPAPPK